MVAFILTSLLALLTAFLLDRCWGDPPQLPHLIVGFGHLISFFEKRCNKGTHRRWKGSLTSLFLICGTFLTVAFLSYLLWQWHAVAYFLFATLIAFYCLAGKTLTDEVRGVFEAVELSLEKGRKQVARIVGRDTATLSEQEIKAAALETLAENLSDGVIAPLFWFFLLGVPGMAMYKMVNTLDSMIGYKNERYGDYGFFAAKTDDFFNYLPARLTALFMLMVSRKLSLWSFVRSFGRAHLSPNSGYPEAALAGILHCRFGGTHDYFGVSVYKPYIGEHDRPFTFHDMERAIRINRLTETAFLFIGMLVLSLLTTLFH